jgi:hypothetical protein
MQSIPRYHYQLWRPQTAIQYPSPWVHSGRNDIFDPSWTPLLRPTPSHPDYVSTHATFGGAAAAVLRVALNNNNDTIERTTWSSNVTIDNRGVITRAYTSLREAAEENAQSRVFGGVSSSCLLGTSGTGVAISEMEKSRDGLVD